MGLKLVAIPHLSQTATSNIRRCFASLWTVSTSQALEKLRQVNERRHLLLERIQEDNEHVRKPPWRESTSKRGGGTFKEKTTEEIRQCLIQDHSREASSWCLQVKNLKINSKERMDGAIELILEKSVSEPGYRATYARLYRRLEDMNMDQRATTHRWISLKSCLTVASRSSWRI